jgi:hypothetical protein
MATSSGKANSTPPLRTSTTRAWLGRIVACLAISCACFVLDHRAYAVNTPIYFKDVRGFPGIVSEGSNVLVVERAVIRFNGEGPGPIGVGDSPGDIVLYICERNPAAPPADPCDDMECRSFPGWDAFYRPALPRPGLPGDEQANGLKLYGTRYQGNDGVRPKFEWDDYEGNNYVGYGLFPWDPALPPDKELRFLLIEADEGFDCDDVLLDKTVRIHELQTGDTIELTGNLPDETPGQEAASLWVRTYPQWPAPHRQDLPFKNVRFTGEFGDYPESGGIRFRDPLLEIGATTDKILVGYRAHCSPDAFSSIVPLLRQLNPDGTLGPLFDGDFHGGGQELPSVIAAIDNYVLTGLNVHAGNSTPPTVNDLQAVFRKWNGPGAALGEDEVVLPPCGQPSGDYYRVRVPAGQVAVGMFGRSARYLDAIGLISADTSSCGSALAPDVVPPTICPGDRRLECTSTRGTPLEYSVAATDVCDSAPMVECSPPSGTLFTIGRRSVVCHAEDLAGNHTVCPFVVQVDDSNGPTLSVSISPSTLWPPNGALVPVSVSVSAVDACDVSPTIRLLSVSSNQGDTNGDVVGADLGTDDRSFYLRASRDPRCGDRLYTITYEAQDATGNRTVSEAQVVVPASQKRLR